MHEALDADLSVYERKGAKDFQALQNGLINCEDYIFTFLEHEEVPHHNNSSEASIRVLKVKAKVSGGFRTQDGADENACFHSIAETAKKMAFQNSQLCTNLFRTWILKVILSKI